MKILKKLKNLFKKTEKIIINELELNKEYNQLKNKILDKQSFKELQKICEFYDIDITLKEIYSDQIKENIHLDQLIQYCQKNKIDIKEILKEKKQIDKKYNVNKLNYKPKINMKIKIE